MGIVVAHDPSALALGNAAQTVGQGKFNQWLAEYQQRKAMQDAQLQQQAWSQLLSAATQRDRQQEQLTYQSQAAQWNAAQQALRQQQQLDAAYQRQKLLNDRYLQSTAIRQSGRSPWSTIPAAPVDYGQSAPAAPRLSDLSILYGGEPEPYYTGDVNYPAADYGDSGLWDPGVYADYGDDSYYG